MSCIVKTDIEDFDSDRYKFANMEDSYSMYGSVAMDLAYQENNRDRSQNQGCIFVPVEQTRRLIERFFNSLKIRNKK